MRRPADELLGHQLVDRFPMIKGSFADDRVREVLADRRPRQFEYYYEPQGRWFEVRAFPDPDGVAVFFRDVDSRYRTDQQRDVLTSLQDAQVLCALQRLRVDALRDAKRFVDRP